MTKAGNDAGLSRSGREPDVNRAGTKVYLVGGGIASLAAAVFLIRDGGVHGQNITILEEYGKLGGSLDGVGPPRNGYVVRGGRAFQSTYVCTFDLFSSIPTLDGSKTVTQEILACNEPKANSSASRSRLFRGGNRLDAPEFGLGEGHILALERLAGTPERLLDDARISDQFDPSFFTTNFWVMWCTTFAFQPWHSAVEFNRYLIKFAHLAPELTRLRGSMRTAFNQYESLVKPIEHWLGSQGVRFLLDTRVTDLGMREDGGEKRVERIFHESAGRAGEIEVGKHDYVIVTLGSMTEGSSLGSSEFPAILNGKVAGGAWTLWERIATGRPEFGRPSAFCDHIDESKWMTFTTTDHAPALFQKIGEITGNVASDGGLITFLDSRWLMSIVLPHQPYFAGQPEYVNVFWGYGLNIDEPGDFVKKPMATCSGREIMAELLGHLRIKEDRILQTAVCMPCMMPFITSQFLRRRWGDRPQVVPEGWTNLGLVGQFCELPDDVVFTVEYSVRSAQTAVYSLLGLKREPPPVYQGPYDPRGLHRALEALHGAET